MKNRSHFETLNSEDSNLNNFSQGSFRERNFTGNKEEESELSIKNEQKENIFDNQTKPPGYDEILKNDEQSLVLINDKLQNIVDLYSEISKIIDDDQPKIDKTIKNLNQASGEMEKSNKSLSESNDIQKSYFNNLKRYLCFSGLCFLGTCIYLVVSNVI